MKNTVCYAAVFCALGFLGAEARAQFPGGGGFGGGFGNQMSRPAISPYLNLNRGGNPAINYYGLVRPQIAFAQAFQTLGNNVVALETATSQPSQTGQRSSFMTQSRYFMNNGGGSGGGFRQGGGQQGGIGGGGGQQQQRYTPPARR